MTGCCARSLKKRQAAAVNSSMLPANRSAATADLRWLPDAFDRVHLVRCVLGQPEYLDEGMGGQPCADDFGGMGWCVIQCQIHGATWVGCRQALQKGGKMGCQLALMIGRAPLAADRIPCAYGLPGKVRVVAKPFHLAQVMSAVADHMTPLGI
jgi:hypothetical protein